MSQTRRIKLGPFSASQGQSCGLTGTRFFIPGGGRKNAKLPTHRTLVSQAVRRMDDGYLLPVVPARGTEALIDLHPFGTTLRNRVRPLGSHALAGFTVPVHYSVALAFEPPAQGSNWLVRQAQGRLTALIGDLWTDAVDMRFAAQMRTLQLGREIGPEWVNACDSLLVQVEALRKKVLEALPEVMTELRQHYPKARLGELYQGALELIDEQLQPILSTIYLWVEAINQWLDPRFHEDVMLLRAAAEQGLMLLLTGQVGSGKRGRKTIKTLHVKVGDLVLVVLTDPLGTGPAVDPQTGQLGPQGAHLMMFPASMLRLIATTGPIYWHEKGHALEAIVEGLAEEVARKIVKAIDSAILPSAKVKIGPGQYVSVKSFLKRVFIDESGEIFADLVGCLVQGPRAFGIDFSTYIMALITMMQGQGLVGRELSGSAGNPACFRSTSTYTLNEEGDGSRTLHVEDHPPDTGRIGSIIPSMAEVQGYPQDAAEMREIARRFAVSPFPTVVTWRFDPGQEEQADTGTKKAQVQLPDITLAFDTWVMAASAVVKALTGEPFESLGGLTLPELACLTPDMHESEVEPLIQLLLAGDSDLEGFVPMHSIDAAAVEAVGRMLEANPAMSGFDAETTVNTTARKMMLGQMARWEAMKRSSNLYNMGAEVNAA